MSETPLEEGVNIGDVVKMELQYNYCREAEVLAQDLAAEDELPVGQVLEPSGTDLVVCTTGSLASAVLLRKTTAAALVAGDVPVACLVRGPAILDVDQLTIVADELDDAVAALLALAIVCRSEPEEISTQTS